MFYLVGWGPGPGYATVRAVKAVKKAQCVFYEDYTGPLDVASLARVAPVEPVRLTRKDLEDESGRKILQCLAEGKTAVLVTAGDPTIATAHAALISAVRKRGYPVEIIPGVSIVCAAFAASCLSIYKLGGVATVTYPRQGVYSERPYEITKLNLSRGLHTLLLLDVREEGSFMPPQDAAGILLELERRMGRGVFTGDRLVVVVHRLGWGGGVLVAPLGQIADMNLQGPAVLIIPAQLGPVERECLLENRGALDISGVNIF